MWINIQLNGIHTIHKTNGKKISFHSIPFNFVVVCCCLSVCLWTMIFVFYIYFHIYNDNVLFFISFSLFVWYTHKQTKTNTVYIGLRPKNNEKLDPKRIHSFDHTNSKTKKASLYVVLVVVMVLEIRFNWQLPIIQVTHTCST